MNSLAKYNLTNYTDFLDEIFSEVNKVGIILENYKIDHLGYRTETNDEYDQVKEELILIADFQGELIVRERRIGIFKFYKPLIYKHYSIETIELLAPTPQQSFKSGFEHAEFIITESLQELKNVHPNISWNINAINRETNPELILNLKENLAVKFHKISILVARKITAETGKL